MAMLDTAIQVLLAFFAVGLLSFLYKDNPAFKVAEHTLLGLQMGITLYGAYSSIVKTGVYPLSTGKWIMLLPIILGLLVYTSYSRDYRWASFIPIAIIIGIGIGLSVRGAATGQFVDQIRATIKPISANQSALKNLENFIIILGTVSSLSYFIFTTQHKGALGGFTKIGRYFIMVAMGAQFGAMATTFLNYTILPITLAITFPGYYLSAIAVVLIIADIIRRRSQT